jgi:hypothetical protein
VRGSSSVTSLEISSALSSLVGFEKIKQFSEESIVGERFVVREWKACS